jgi:NAD(P)-dependent dehydrogenase (short-subunit alcohol dehydrogenase family)
VTGGNRGLGRAIAFALADVGAAVAIMARDEEKNRETVGELKKLGVPALALKVDLMKRADLKPAMDEVERVLGPIDILVNNAAFAILKGVLDQTAEEWDQVIATNLNACFLLAQIAARSMVARKGTAAMTAMGMYVAHADDTRDKGRTGVGQEQRQQACTAHDPPPNLARPAAERCRQEAQRRDCGHGPKAVLVDHKPAPTPG